MAIAHATRLTVDEYFVAAASDPRPTQLIDGVIVPNQPKWRHQRTVGLIHARLLAWIEAGAGHGVAGLPIDVVLDTYNCYAPDVFWLGDARRLDLDAVFHGPPDLAVEVRSPSTWRYDTGIKKARYLQYGLPELWLVDTRRDVVTVCGRSAPEVPAFDVEITLRPGDQVTSPQLPGFALAAAELFPPEPPG